MEDLPEDVAADRAEAWNCFLGGQYRAAILMARTTLQRAVRLLLAENQISRADQASLFEELDLLVEGGVITKQLAKNAHEVRLSGNDVAHPEALGDVSDSDAGDGLAFLDDFLETTLAVPARQRRRAEKRSDDE